MAQRNIDFGSFPDDPNADAIRTAFQKVQENFSELFSGLQEQAVISVNRTAGTGTTVNSPTGNVIISANIAQVRIQSTTLDLSTGSNASPASLAVINQGTVPIFINIPQSITGIANITLSGTLAAPNVNVSSQLNGSAANFTGNVNTTANVTAGNVYANSGTVSASLFTGTLTTAAQPNITSVGTLSSLSVSGNVSSGNANLGNLVTANFFTGDGSLLTNVSAVANTRIVNGTSYANIPVSGGNLNIVIAGNPTMNVTATGANITGTANVSGNLSAGNLIGILANGGSSNITIASATGNVTTAVAGTARITATSTGANITGTLGVSSTLSVTGNANVGNLGTAQVLATANVTAPQLISNIATGTAPLTVTSTTRVANLNVAYANVADFISVAAGTGNNFLIFANAATGNVTELTSTGLTANLSNNSITATTFVGALSGAATTAGTVTTNAQPNITSVGTLTALGVNGNIIAANINANTGVFTGNGSGLSAIAGANVTGTVSSATTASTAGTVTTNAQPNITSVGTLTSLGVNGTVTAVAFTANTGVFTGNGNGLSSIVGANVTGTVANATFATSAGSATTAGTVTTAAQPNITSVGTLSSLSVTGNLSSGNANLGNAATANFFIGSGNNLSNIQGANVTGAVASATSATTAGTVTTAAQPNITSVGTLSSLGVSGNLSSGNANLGNAARANFFVGDGSLLTNISVGAGSFIVNGNSEVRVDANSNVRITVSGNANVLTVTGTGANITGTANVTGNITAGNVAATSIAGNLSTAAQPNITSLGTLTGLTVNGVSNLGPNSNVIITGGVANAFLRTNGSGNLTWDTATLVPAQGANTQVIFNDGGTVYAGSSSLTFDKTTNILTVNGNISVGNISGANNITSNFFTGTLRTNAQPNITSVGTLTGLNVNNTITAVNITANTGVFTGNGSGLTNLNANSITSGIVSSDRLTGTYSISVTGSAGSATTATSATTAGTVTTNAQPNITSVGTLTGLLVNGNLSAANITVAAGTITANVFSGNATSLSNIPGANVTGTVASATAATTAGTVTTNAQPNITSVGTLTTLGVNNTITAVAFTANTGVFTGNANGLSSLQAGNLTGTVAQARLANSSLTVNGTAISLGGSGTITANTTQTLTLGSFLTGTSFNGGTAVTAAVDATSANTASKVVARDASGNFSAGTITATLSGSATSAGTATTAGTVTTAAQPNITSVSTSFTGLTLAANGNITLSGASSQITGANLVSAGFFSGNGSSITGINATSIASGTLAQARLANSSLTVNGTAISLGGSGTVTANTTQVLTLGSFLTGTSFNGGTAVTATVDATSANTASKVVARDGSGNFSAGTITATLSGSATTAGTVTTAAQPNITSTGTLTSLTVSGNITAQSNVNMSGYVIRSVDTGIIALGLTQLTAVALTKEINVVSTVVPLLNTGVRLPVAVPGMVITIINTSGNTLSVWPNTGADINGGTVNAAYLHSAGATLQYIAPNTTDWYTVGATFA